MNIKEVFYRHTSHGWVCQDRKGNVVKVPTKEMAEIQYGILYGIETEPKSFVVDINKYNRI